MEKIEIFSTELRQSFAVYYSRPWASGLVTESDVTTFFNRTNRPVVIKNILFNGMLFLQVPPTERRPIPDQIGTTNFWGMSLTLTMPNVGDVEKANILFQGGSGVTQFKDSSNYVMRTGEIIFPNIVIYPNKTFVAQIHVVYQGLTGVATNNVEIAANINVEFEYLTN